MTELLLNYLNSDGYLRKKILPAIGKNTYEVDIYNGLKYCLTAKIVYFRNKFTVSYYLEYTVSGNTEYRVPLSINVKDGIINVVETYDVIAKAINPDRNILKDLDDCDDEVKHIINNINKHIDSTSINYLYLCNFFDESI